MYNTTLEICFLIDVHLKRQALIAESDLMGTVLNTVPVDVNVTLGNHTLSNIKQKHQIHRSSVQTLQLLINPFMKTSQTKAPDSSFKRFDTE